MSIKIYVSGRDDMSLDVELISIKKRFSRRGFGLIIPQEKAFTRTPWADGVQNRLEALKKCDVIYMLPKWQESIISRIELTAAMDLKKETLFHPVSNEDIKQLLTALDS